MSSPDFFGISEVAYMLAMIGYITYLIFKKQGVGFVATVITILGFVSQTTALILRWNESYKIGYNHAPLTNLYESLVFFIWCLILGYLIVEFTYKNRTFGAFVTPVAGLVLAFIDLTGMSKEIQPLVPALKSNWLLVHVMLTFMSYSAFSISFSTAIMYLILTTSRNQPAYFFWIFTVGFICTLFLGIGLAYIKFATMYKVVFICFGGLCGLMFLLWKFGYILKDVLNFFKLNKEILEDITYKSIAVGFPIFTIGGLIFGAIWADQAWGVYWSWDPKETWSLITWIVYAVYLHAKYMRGWRGTKVAVLSIIGFLSVIITYIGVNLLLTGLHSYGSS